MSVRIGSGNQSVIADSNQNEVGTINDGYALRLQVESALKPGTSISVGGAIPDKPNNILRAFLDNNGNDDLRVDGSTAPVEFNLTPDPIKDIRINELRFIMSISQVKFNGDSFGSRRALTNGISIEVQSDQSYTLLANIRINEEFLSFNAPGNIVLMGSGSEDVVISGLNLAGAVVLRAGSGDFVKVTVRDDLTHPSYYHLRCAIYGYKEDTNEQT